jgi:hypothetical protein
VIFSSIAKIVLNWLILNLAILVLFLRNGVDMLTDYYDIQGSIRDAFGRSMGEKLKFLE